MTLLFELGHESLGVLVAQAALHNKSVAAIVLPADSPSLSRLRARINGPGIIHPFSIRPLADLKFIAAPCANLFSKWHRTLRNTLHDLRTPQNCAQFHRIQPYHLPTLPSYTLALIFRAGSFPFPSPCLAWGAAWVPAFSLSALVLAVALSWFLERVAAAASFPHAF